MELNDSFAKGAKQQDIMIVTTREKDERPNTYFNGERASGASYAEASISVPPKHKLGAIEWPKELPGNPSTDFVARKANYIADKEQFKEKLNQRLSKLPKGKRQIFLFIHGYNIHFPEGLYRFAQIAHDTKTDAIPVFFSWASRGKAQDYIYDLNSAAIARKALQDTLVMLAQSKAEEVTVLAHSMGTWLLMETVLQATEKERQLLSKKLKHVILAAPDIDIDLFRAQLSELNFSHSSFTVIVSRDDRALRISTALAGGKERVGAYPNEKELAKLGATVVDITELNALDGLHHTKFSQLEEFSPEFRKTLEQSDLISDSTSKSPKGLGQNLRGFVGSTLRLPIDIITSF
ncbi:alpha/beta hydrolase [Pseudovibrio sp. JE062]|uniref:alpha/beta hydrolase n=1 Tax=Pseudovibrio sp. JE062 TaxID=439495 RepID=UPI001AD9278D|nr:alpha/beta hydrolase [Pseudovibrio sp. JE062]